MAVTVVTDSASDIPDDIAQRLGVTVVPLNVHFGTRAFKDNVTITPDEFYSMMADSPELPTTSLVSPGEFKETYDRLGERRRRHSVHPHIFQNQRHLQLRIGGGQNDLGGVPHRGH